MELNEVIVKRKSIRKYTNEEISKEVIESIIDSARLAPSAKNRQPWNFVVVQNTIKNKIADMMIKKENELLQTTDRKGSSVINTAKIIKEAPVLILVLKEYDENWIIGDCLSIGAAIEHICLKATDLGLGSLWIADTVYVQKDIVKLVGHENMQVISAISIGYSDQEPNRRPRKELEDILKWYNEQ